MRETGEEGEEGVKVTAVEPDRRDARRVVVRCGRKALARIDDAAAAELGIAPGVELDGAALARLAAVEDELKARDAALRLLKVKSRSRAEIVTRLAAKGFAPEVAQRAAARLERVGLIDDEALAKDVIERGLERGSSRRMVESKLAARGVDGDVRIDDEAAALAEARARAASMRGVDGRAAGRRLLSHLARRGFEEDAARMAVERVASELGWGIEGAE